MSRSDQVLREGRFLLELGDIASDPVQGVVVVIEPLDDGPAQAVLGAEGESEDQAAGDFVAAVGDEPRPRTGFRTGGAVIDRMVPRMACAAEPAGEAFRNSMICALRWATAGSNTSRTQARSVITLDAGRSSMKALWKSG